MIPGSFSYHRPASVADAVKLLSELGEAGRNHSGTEQRISHELRP